MKIVVGLGNPGSQYRTTRHNIGWLLLDRVAEDLDLLFDAGKGDYLAAEGRKRGRRFTMVKPTTYMNRSGEAIRQVLRHTKTTIDDLLVVVDEIQLPVGRLKLTASGSDGGHNGLSSIIEVLGTDRFARLRCGVGSDFPTGRMADYVLSPFFEEEIEERDRMIDDGGRAILSWVHDGTTVAMNRINRRKKASSSAEEQNRSETDERTTEE